jgi:hypothetical protein
LIRIKPSRYRQAQRLRMTRDTWLLAASIAWTIALAVVLVFILTG